jgi:hypothetical protein
VDLNPISEVFNRLCWGRGSGFIYLPSMKGASKAQKCLQFPFYFCIIRLNFSFSLHFYHVVYLVFIFNYFSVANWKWLQLHIDFFYFYV